MMYTLKSGKVIKADWEYGNKPAKWKPAGRHYTVTVKVGRKEETFDFWDSYHNAANRIRPDMRGAIACWAGDALIESLGQYADLGPMNGDAVRGCMKALEQARRLGLSDDDLCELSDY